MPAPLSLPDFPNEVLLAIMARVEFSFENFTRLSLVSKHFYDLMKTHKTRILNDVAEAQFSEAGALRQRVGDHSVSSIFDLYGITYCIDHVVPVILQNQLSHASLPRHPQAAKILTTSFYIYDALRKRGVDPRKESDSTLFLLFLGRQAVVSMYYSSMMLHLCLLRKAVDFEHQRWLRVLSHPAAIAVIQNLLIKAGIAFFSGLVADDRS